MPITSAFDPTEYISSAQAILREHLRDTFPQGNFNITFEFPALDTFSKPVIWLRLSDGADLQVEKYSYEGVVKTGQTKLLTYEVVIITNEASGASKAALDAAVSFEIEAIAKGKPSLGRVGLRKAKCSSFTQLPPPGQQKQWWMEAQLSFEVMV